MPQADAGHRRGTSATGTLFDAVADHLLVVDHAIGAGAGGRRRHLSSDPARRGGDDRAFLFGRRIRSRVIGDFPGNSWNSGRSCVDAAYRNRAAMQLLWRGIAAYVFHHRST